MTKPLQIIAAALLALAAPALAIEPPSVSHVWQGPSGTEAAAGGYDLVAYFAGSATPGSKDFSATHKGATYLFSSIANRDTFLADPERYLPAFGGHCAWAASQGRKAGPDPKVFRVDGGILYLNCSRQAEANWLAGQPDTMKAATAWWAEQTK
ncbi:MAG: YHS domain-containing (seleno)protein [Polymorphobacter sp.]|uniref:YHS domain-containing (seleno)protein n=1 Tax=Polymorphobacter sp. TaxID=1909290 RepID=UPI003A842AE8